MPKRRSTFRIDSSELVGDRLRVDGYLSRVGIQIYDDGFGGRRREYRDPDEVFNTKSLASLKAMPVTIQHPRGRVNSKNWKTHSVGHVGDDPRQADDGIHVMASVWVMDQRTIDRVRSGELSELSVGYTAALDETPGMTPDGERYDARQLDIRGNHLALLKEGQARGGRSVKLRLDSAGDAIFDDDPEDEKMKVKIKADGLVFDVEATDDNVCKALEKERADSERILKDAEEATSAAEARADAAEEKLSKVKKELETVQKAAREKELEHLRADALKVAPALSIKGSDTPEQIRRCALEEVGVSTKDRDDVYVQVRFDMALEQVAKEPKKPSVFDRSREKKDTREQAPVISIDAAARALR